MSDAARQLHRSLGFVEPGTHLQGARGAWAVSARVRRTAGSGRRRPCRGRRERPQEGLRGRPSPPQLLVGTHCPGGGSKAGTTVAVMSVARQTPDGLQRSTPCWRITLFSHSHFSRRQDPRAGWRPRPQREQWPHFLSYSRDHVE